MNIRAEKLTIIEQLINVDDKEILIKLARKHIPFWVAEGITLCNKCHNLNKKRIVYSNV